MYFVCAKISETWNDRPRLPWRLDPATFETRHFVYVTNDDEQLNIAGWVICCAARRVPPSTI